MPILSAEARHFVDRHRVARLATANGAGEPHVIPFCYALMGECIYFVIDEKPKRTHQGLQRLQNIRSNPHVAMLIDDYDDEWSQLAFLLVHGVARIVTERVKFDQALLPLRTRYPQYARMPLSFEQNPMVCITPTRARLWRSTKAEA